MAAPMLTVLKLAALCSSLAAEPIFYAPLDGHTRATLVPYSAGTQAQGAFESVQGIVGKAVRADAAPLDYDLAGLLTREQGTVAAWVKVPWDPNVKATHMILDLGPFGSLRRWQHQLYLTYTLWYHHIDEKHDYGCTSSIEGWKPGEWHHIAITWSWPMKRRALYHNGQCVRSVEIKRQPNVVTLFRIGPELSAVDEVYAFDTMLPDPEVTRLFQSGRSGRPAYDLGPMPPVRKTAAALPDEPRPARPAFVNWSFDGATQQDNGLRGEVTLNAWWRWQRAVNTFVPPKPQAWLYRKAPALSHYGESFPVCDPEGRRVPSNDPRAGSLHKLIGAHVWCEREFALPASWRGRRIVLDVDSIVKGGSIYLNRQLLDFLPELSLGGTYDVTERVRWAEPNLLSIRSHGIDGDITLRSTPSHAHIDDAWLKTSYRRKRVECELTATCSSACAAVVDIADPATGQAVKRLRTDVPAGRGIVATAAEQWLPPKLWSLEEPNLYAFTVKLVDPTGQTVDKTFPKAFGFRELWIDRDKFLLNSVPTYFIGHSNAHVTATSEAGCAQYLRYSFKRWQAAGLNCVTPWQGTGRNPTYAHLLNVADEMGMGIFIHAGLPNFERRKFVTDETEAQYEAVYRRYITRYRQHPSLLGWMIGGGSHVFDFCPAVMDNSFDPGSVPDWDRPKELKKGWQLADRYDPTRIKFGLSEGNIGPIWTSMAYQGFDVELRERRNWPWAWHRVRHKPVMPCEFSLPYYRDWFMRTQRRSGRANYAPAGTHSIATEYAAMYFGDQAYAWDDEDYVASLKTSPGSPYKARSCWETKNLFADTLLSWRTYGISFVYHAEVPYLFTGNQPRFPQNPKLDPRRPGGAPEGMHGSLQAADKLSEFGQRVKAATAPVVAYIAGPGGEFWYTDHAYLSGEAIRKAAVVLNLRNKPLDYRLVWRAVGSAGRPVAEGAAAGRLDSGGRTLRACAIEFPAPNVAERTDLRIELDLEADVKMHDKFSVTVFPKARPVRQEKAVLLFDPVGNTQALLKEAGVDVQKMGSPIPSHGLLVAGRHALEKEEWRNKLADAGFDAAVAKGLRVLVFEQASDQWEGNVMGLKLRRTATRHAFVRAPQHPCIAGLEPSDFHYFRRDSDLIEAHPKPGNMPTSYPIHFWHWGNDNIVATYVLEKPQVGAARALVDCGFDLSETPLLEVARGNGAVIFCQLDVTNRYGVDPVATRLVHNLLTYLLTLERGTPSAPEPQELARRIPTQGEVSLYRSQAPAIPGVGNSELFFREKLTLPAFDPKSSTPLFAQTAGQWATSLSLAKLNTPWQKAKRGRIEAALRIANGTRSDAGSQLKLQGNSEALYPFDWTRIESMKASFDPYVYWRW